MASKCPSCNKFCSLELQDPEINDLNITENGTNDKGNTEAIICFDIRIVRTSECCGDEIKEANFCDAFPIVIEGHSEEGCTLNIEEGDCESTETGGSRYAKSYYGFELSAKITCSCGNPVKILESEEIFEDDMVTISNNCAASEMDELV